MSVLFADMVDYTGTLERLGEENTFPFVRMVYDRLAACVREHDGSIHAFGGDSVMAVFGISETTEDAALKACRAAIAIQSVFGLAGNEIESRFHERPHIRVGVSSGLAVVASVDSESTALTTIGNTVNLASRMQTLAPSGGCLVCDSTRRLIEWQVDLEFHSDTVIKGVAKPQRLWRLLKVHDNASRFDTSRGRGLSPLVGREANLAALHDALQQSQDAMCTVDLVAEPGLGKTRLIFEFLQGLKREDGVVLQGHCTADGQQTPFLPFLEVARGAFGIGPEDAPAVISKRLVSGLRRLRLESTENKGLLLNLLGLAPDDGSLAGLDGVLIGLRTRSLLADLLTAQCRVSKVVLLLEDIQWIDSTSEDILARLVEGAKTANLLVIHARRPEYVPRWLEAPGVVSQSLAPLSSAEVVSLVTMRLGVDQLPASLTDQITDRAGGNPLFSEEILAFLVEQGALRVENGDALFDVQSGASALPASLLGLLAARVDRLTSADRTLLQVAAVIGRRFDAALLSASAPEFADVDAALRRLEQQDVIYLDDDGFTYIFKHVLMRDCVYHSLLTDRRSALHLTIAAALEQRSEGRLVEVAEVLAHHFAQSDRRDCTFIYLAMAGNKSLRLFSHGEADQFFSAALALHEADPRCASDEEFASLLASYALCLNVSLCVEPMIRLAAKTIPALDRIGDSRNHALFLHHYVSCLICNARFRNAHRIQQQLTAMSARLDDPVASAYALVSELSISTYFAPMTIAAFDAGRHTVEEALVDLDDAYLQNFYLATVGWDEVCRGQVIRAHATANRLIEMGTATNDPRSLGYGTAMRALIASVTDDYEQALELAERALVISRAKFEQTIASAARCGALVMLKKPGAAAEVQRHLDTCAEHGWEMFCAGPDLMLGVAHVVNGRIGDGLALIEAGIARNEAQGFRASADWGRLYLCEIYLTILTGEGGASAGVLLRNFGALSKVFLHGRRRIAELIDRVRSSAQFDPDGHNMGRAEIITGLLFKLKKNPERARSHLTEARRIIGASGSSPLLSRIDQALPDLAA